MHEGCRSPLCALSYFSSEAITKFFKVVIAYLTGGVKSVLLNYGPNNCVSQHGHLMLAGDSSWSCCVQSEGL